MARPGQLLPAARRLALAVMLATGSAVLAQTAPDLWPEPGPPATRDLFPLNLIPLSYRPLGARTLGRGKLAVTLQLSRGNTFEFSEAIKNALSQDIQGRIQVDLQGATAFAAEHLNEPLLYFFDCEIQRTELQFKVGATDNTDLGLTLSWQGISGGYLDSPIESFHKLGFEQTGRGGMAKNQITLMVLQEGRMVIFDQHKVVARPEDPVVTLVHRIHEDPRLTVSLAGLLQLPLTRWRGTFKSNWDSSVALVSEWRFSPRQVLNGGVAYLRRSVQQDGPSPFFIKDQMAGHVGWEWRGWRLSRPYLLLLATTGLAAPGPGAKLDKPALLHDLGVHLRLGQRSVLTLSYINNISHNENTADMAVAMRLTVRP